MPWRSEGWAQRTSRLNQCSFAFTWIRLLACVGKLSPDSSARNFCRIEQDRYRPLVYQFHRHHLLKPSGLAAKAGRADFSTKYSYSSRALCGGAASSNDGRLPLRASPYWRELGNDQHSATHVYGRPVHLAAVVIENAENRRIFSAR